ncbi:MAG: PAC2 family protein [Candidatus Micrarchaeia archaeon]
MPREHPSFQKSFVKEKKKPKLKKAILVVGLPGIGLVSKLAVDHLVKTLDAKRFATVYSPYLPNQVLALKTGRLRSFNLMFYHAKLKGRDAVFLRGDLQPLTVEGQYEVTGRVLSYFSSLGGTEVLAMAGFAVNKKGKPNVYCTSTSKKTLEKFVEKTGAKTTPQVVPVVGLAGMIPGLSNLYQMRGTCLLVETPGNVIDPTGAKVLVESLEKYTGTKLDTKKLESSARKTQKLIHSIEQQAQKEEQRATLSVPASKESLSYIR